MAAPTPDISSILAALANQGRNTTPGQPVPPYQQPNSASNAYHPTAPPPAAPPAQYPPPHYGLPQPPPAANYDLNAIRPINSGTVSISDAIAQAKAYAAEKGLVSYERPPPQSTYPSAAYQPHDDRNYRGRSRSPPSRRDAYRDNYNPYRDERRDDRGAHARDYGRDRSMSPGHNRGRPSGTFSPPHRGGRDRGGDDSMNEIMEIESSLVGLIIGRQGENLKRIESETGCRVQFLSPAGEPGAYRQCKITGPAPRRAEARAAMNRIIEDSGMGAIARAGLDKHQQGNRNSGAYAPAPVVAAPSSAALRDGEDCVQIMVPDRTVGLIIGRGGETIRDLQERSGCHINIVGESKSVNGLRPVNLIGPHAAAAQAKELILEIVDSDTRNGSNQDTNTRPSVPKTDHPRPNPQAQQAGPDKINDAIYVPSEAVGMIIGKGGETIREMQNNTGCKINVSQPSGPGEVEREIGLVGTRDAISRAKQAIEDKVEAVRQKNSGGGGRGGRPQNRRDWDNPNNNNNYSQPASNQPSAADPQASAAANGAADPYAPYGGYQAYLTLWYQALATQQGGGQSAEMPKPPGA
ncbi:hypothetical protein F5Y16DRAFT_163959 [Xylariaceae sp. FL0255]|nr:hypothetical protein F5Y16DRAFT_163959 [Xylariaceae sp. FL0255]